MMILLITLFIFLSFLVLFLMCSMNLAKKYDIQFSEENDVEI